MDTKCRLCSASGKSLIDIFGKTGADHKLTEKINQRLQIFVTREDFLSKSICYNCCGKLDIFDQFVKDVHKTQTVLQRQSTDVFKQTRLLKNENTIETIEIEDDSQPVSSSCYDKNFEMCQNQLLNFENRQSCKDDNHVSVIRYQTSPFINHNDETRQLNISSTKFEDVISDDEMNSKMMNGDLNVSNGFHDNEIEVISSGESDSDVASTVSVELHRNKHLMSENRDEMPLTKRLRSNSKTRQHKILEQNPKRRKSGQIQEVKKTDFSAQAGNTLWSDLKSLKNSLLLRKASIINASVLTIPVPILPNDSSNKRRFCNTVTSKGCQTEILLGVKSNNIRSTVVYQKVSFEGRSFFEIGSESDAVITSVLPL